MKPDIEIPEWITIFKEIEEKIKQEKRSLKQ